MPQKTIVVSDTGPLISLGLLNRLELFTTLFDDIYIPNAVWEEIQQIRIFDNISEIKMFLRERVKRIAGENNLLPFVDYGESEAILLYKEIKADYLVIDDKKARDIAEALQVKCIGTIGILYRAKQKRIIQELRPLFLHLIQNKRYYSRKVLNQVLDKAKEKTI